MSSISQICTMSFIRKPLLYLRVQRKEMRVIFPLNQEITKNLNVADAYIHNSNLLRIKCNKCNKHYLFYPAIKLRKLT